LERHERFRNNFAAKKRLVQSGDIFAWGGEDLLVATIDREDFGDFLAILRGICGGLSKSSILPATEINQPVTATPAPAGGLKSPVPY